MVRLARNHATEPGALQRDDQVTILVEPEATVAESLAFAIGGQVAVLDGVHEVGRRLEQEPTELLVVLGPDVEQSLAFGLAEDLRLNRPHVGVVLLRRRVDVIVMGHALRAGVREVVDPEDLAALGAACNRSLEISRRHAGASGAGAEAQPEGRVVTVFSAKGGCGKTTVATNLGATLANGGDRRVCIVDLDLAFGDVAIALQLVPARTITDSAAMVGTMDEQGVRSLITPHSPGLDTLLAPTEPGQAERVDVKAVGELVRVLRRMYDYPQAAWLVTLNRSDSKVGLGTDEVERTLRVPIAIQIPSSRAVSASINRGVPIVVDEPNHPVSQAIRQLARVVIERSGGAPREAAVEAPVRRGRGLSVLRRGAAR